MNNYDVAVIGAGISGLSLAYFCKKAGKRVIVLEKEKRVGGCLHTVYHNEGRLELAGHTLYNSYGAVLQLIRESGLIDQLQKRVKLPYRLYQKGAFTTILRKISYLELLRSMPRMCYTNKEGLTVSEYYAKVLGPKNYQELFRHFFNAVLSQEADAFPANLLFKKRTRDKSVLKSFSLPQGLTQLVEALAKTTELMRETEVTHIQKEKDGYQLTVAGREPLSASKLVIATPSSEAARLLAPLYPKLADLLASINTQQLESTGVLCQANTLKLEQLSGIVPTAEPFYSAVSMDPVRDETAAWRGFTFHFKDPAPKQAERLEVIQRVLSLKNPPEQVYHRTTIMPVYRQGHYELMARLEQILDELPLYLIGNYHRGISIEDCVLHSKQTAQTIA